MARSLNKVELIGNLTRDPELRYTPQGNAVCTFGLATNRQWVTDSGEKREDAEFHRIVAWNKLAELCSQLLSKGRKIYVEGRLQTRKWQAQDGSDRVTTEIVINDMIILDSRGAGASDSAAASEVFDIPDDISTSMDDVSSDQQSGSQKQPASKSSASSKVSKKDSKETDDNNPPEDEDIPF